MKSLPSLVDFSVYLFYFPKMLSGPIERPLPFFKKLLQPELVNGQLISKGFGLILSGLIRKVFIASILSSLMPDWIKSEEIITWYQVLGYVLLVYNDFAGYSAIVRGVSFFFGIDLLPNFKQPFLSRNFSEFWTRWHITLSDWLKETIYFPITRKIKKLGSSFALSLAAIIFPPLITMLVSGFWHGASLAMILWGGIQGFVLMIEQLIHQKWPGLRSCILLGRWRFLSIFAVFIIFAFTMVPFAVGTVKPAFQIWKNLFTLSSVTINRGALTIIIIGVFSFILDFLSSRYHTDIWWENLHVIPRSAVIVCGLLLLAVGFGLTFDAPSSVFIYQGF